MQRHKNWRLPKFLNPWFQPQKHIVFWANSELPTAAVVYMLKITGHQEVADRDKSGLQDSLDQEQQTRWRRWWKGGAFFAAVIPKAMGNPKINIGWLQCPWTSMQSHWITEPANLNANLNFCLWVANAGGQAFNSWISVHEEIWQFYIIYINNRCIWPILKSLHSLSGAQKYNSELKWWNTRMNLYSFFHSFIQHHYSCLIGGRHSTKDKR